MTQRSAVDFGICALKVSWSDNRIIEADWSQSKPIEVNRSQSKIYIFLKLWLTSIASTITSIDFDWYDRSLRLTSIDIDRLRLLRSLRSVRLTSPGQKCFQKGLIIETFCSPGSVVCLHSLDFDLCLDYLNIKHGVLFDKWSIPAMHEKVEHACKVEWM